MPTRVPLLSPWCSSPCATHAEGLLCSACVPWARAGCPRCVCSLTCFSCLLLFPISALPFHGVFLWEEQKGFAVPTLWDRQTSFRCPSAGRAPRLHQPLPLCHRGQCLWWPWSQQSFPSVTAIPHCCQFLGQHLLQQGFILAGARAGGAGQVPWQPLLGTRSSAEPLCAGRTGGWGATSAPVPAPSTAPPGPAPVRGSRLFWGMP